MSGLHITVDDVQLIAIPLPRAAGAVLAQRGDTKALLVNTELTIAEARQATAGLLLGDTEARFPTRADGIRITSATLPDCADSAWAQGPDGRLTLVLNDSMLLSRTEDHVAQQLRGIAPPEIEAHRAS